MILKQIYFLLFFSSLLVADVTIQAPSNLSFTDVTKNSVTLNWVDNATNETGFKIFRDDMLIFTTDKNVTTFTDSSLESNRSYEYEVKATTDGDIQAPTLSLNGESRVNINKDSSYTELGASAEDDFGGDMSGDVVITSTVDTTQAGIYSIIYSVTDANNNKATKTRTVVVWDNIAATIFDASFEADSVNLSLENNATYEANIKRSGLQSLQLSNTNDTVNIVNIPVQEGKWYIFRGYMYVDALPHDIVRFYIGYTNNGSHVRSAVYTLLSNAKANSWEEFIVPIYVQKDKNVTDMKMFIKNSGKPDTNETVVGNVWIDDMGVYKVDDTSQFFGNASYTQKDAFDGSYVKVDSLGNFSVKDSSTFKAFFPIIIYPSPNTVKWDLYKTQGFNTSINNIPLEAQGAVDAGLYWVWDLGHYGINDLNASGYDTFVSQYDDMRDNHPDIFNKLLYFYWDNEKYEVSKSLKKFIDKIKLIDVDANGKRYRPFSMNLNLTEGSKLYYNDFYKLIDIQSAYVNPIIYQENDVDSYGYEFKGWYNGEFAHFAVFDNIENLKVPKSVFVVNSPQDEHLEKIIFAALARGGKGFSFWRDSGNQPEVETRLWWDSFPSIALKLNQLLPLIRQPHWTNWILKSSEPDDEDGIIVGKRDYDSKRCMIVASRADIDKNVTFSTPDRDMGEVYNFFDNALVASPSEGNITISLPAHGSGVYCW